MKSLITPRLVLREWEEKDAGFILDMYSRWDVMRYLGAEPQVLTDLAGARARLAAWRDRQDDVHTVWAVQDRQTGHLLGTAFLVRLLAGTPLTPAAETEIGWHLHPDAWGRGYATEAATAVLAYAARFGISPVLAVTYPENAASQAVCRRLGMRHLGRTDRYYNMTCELFST
ncbi:putative GCN5-related N-acetyltransferase [Actinoplanes missouriensis 431]|uniref:Putative GCN5-related N-acetyltransferase n=1 Tax=Actinoplanes missouriensis (strain ATCC 14538 / DSM 43046 / CBS 188.64 / JCM 3121 / NBRC 102363 / NCIMB 12654 / NRRL B-3342 / UNCC 431) TaxID=512565 RepID=I0HE62_ACTM4|nr:GNAT family N-acetyltransferase [Actinoplanes missouriensis]BAL91299.1 putative GCN5-related N-acetyltransferase [Actinoplanes missouriensis 431]